jgi:tRNA uridine 5-carbamoylmethylation protein Kti12
MATIGDNETKDFALSLIAKRKDLEVKFEIVNCINKIDSTFLKNFKMPDPSENHIINKILTR